MNVDNVLFLEVLLAEKKKAVEVKLEVTEEIHDEIRRFLLVCLCLPPSRPPPVSFPLYRGPHIVLMLSPRRPSSAAAVHEPAE